MPGKLSSKPTVVDLYAGAGLFSYAFSRSGFGLVRAIEIDPVAAATYSANLGSHVEVADIRAVAASGRCTVLIAGPVCQGFSTLGKRDKNDPRNLLSLEVVRWAKVLRPKVIVVENVAAFLDSPIWSVLAAQLGRLGYNVSSSVFDAHEFGVPQRRIRSFTFASRGRAPRVEIPERRGFGTVRKAWRGLASEPDSRNHHYSPRPSDLALARMKVIRAGGDKRDVMRYAPQLAAPSWWRLPCEITDVWGRMEWDEPSNTIRTALQNPSKGRYIHPEQHRVISLREAARLQSIPDSWHFTGLPTQVARQIGNSVPPLLGRAIAKAVNEAL
jgi:DNA (cytosine-5)-methyltransferase 1